jgi:hypothetical protein
MPDGVFLDFTIRRDRHSALVALITVSLLGLPVTTGLPRKKRRLDLLCGTADLGSVMTSAQLHVRYCQHPFYSVHINCCCPL